MRKLILPALFFATVLYAKSPSIAILSPQSEPGARLIVAGQVFAPDGKTPVAGVKVYAYHTDAKGYYNKPGVQDPRLKGTVITDANGKFELHTIRPGAYPQGSEPAHIHFVISGAGYKEQWWNLEFADDPRVKPRALAESRADGRFGQIATTRRDAQGVLHATMGIRLSK